VGWSPPRDGALADVDQIVELGRKNALHVNLCFYRGPGYCIADKNPANPVEPMPL
jgi:hypothetical protein